MFSQIRQVPVTQEVMKQILDAIRDGKLSSGDRLPSEKVLVSTFGVARSTVREALGVLEAMGIVQGYRGRGYFVSEIKPEAMLNEEVLGLVLATEEFQQVQDVRKILETEVAGVVAARMDPKLEAQLQRILDQITEGIRDGTNIYDLTWLFHKTLAGMSGNRVLAKLIDILSSTIRKSQILVYYPFVDKASELDSHRHLLEALKTGDPAVARETMKAHLEGVDKVVEGARRAFAADSADKAQALRLVSR